MGVYHFARVNIELKSETGKKEILKILDKSKEEYSEFSVCDKSIYFDLTGNNGVDYSTLDELKKVAQKKKIKIEIMAGEYAETGGGYYFDSEDEVEE